MPVSQDQYVTLGNDIRANSDPVVVQAIQDGNHGVIANWYNQNAAPDFYVWRTSLSNMEMKDAIVWSEFIAATSQADRDTFGIMREDGSVNPSQINIRTGFSEIFSGPQIVNTRTALLTASKRLASYAEKLLADVNAGNSTNPLLNGNGSVAAPATMTFEGALTALDVSEALNATAP